MFKKRLCAFVIDIVLVFLIVSFIEFFIPNSENVTNLSDQMLILLLISILLLVIVWKESYSYLL